MPQPTPLMPNPGSERDPDHFVGRRAFTSEALTCLRQGMSLLISDPRRMGKSFWLRWLAARTSEFTIVWIDHEGVQTVDDFVARTAAGLASVRSLPSSGRAALRTFFDNTDIEATIKGVTIRKHFASDPLPVLTDTLAAVDDGLRDASPPLVLAMDEVPVAIENLAVEAPREAMELLRTMRLLRQGSKRVRWIVTGSVGFHHVLRRCGATTGEVNDLHSLIMGPLDGADATELATRLFEGIRRIPGPGAIEAMVHCTGGIPQLIHELASRLQFESLGRATRDVQASDIESVFEAFIDDRDQSHAVTHYLTRLDKYYSKDYFGHQEVTTAYRLLDAVCHTGGRGLMVKDWPATVADDPLAQSVVDSLIGDHYLQESSGSLTWRYPVLERIYARRRRLAIA